MSLDAQYIFCYYVLGYVNKTPMEKDKEYLEHKHGGKFISITEYVYYWVKPKYLLLEEDINNIHADQILEKRDCELFRIIKG